MNQKTENRILSRLKDDFFYIGVLSALVLYIILASGCASWQGKPEKEIPCKVAPEGIAGLYGAKLSAVDTPDRMIRLKLSPDFRSELLTDNLDDKPAIIETGQWECKDGLKVTVTLTGRKDLAYEKPQSSSLLLMRISSLPLRTTTVSGEMKFRTWSGIRQPPEQSGGLCRSSMQTTRPWSLKTH